MILEKMEHEFSVGYVPERNVWVAYRTEIPIFMLEHENIKDLVSQTLLTLKAYNEATGHDT